MKCKSIAMLTALVTIMLSAAASADPVNRAIVQLTEPTIIGTIAFLPGEYAIEWNGGGPDVRVSFSVKNNMVAKIPATLEMEKNHPCEFLVTAQNYESDKRLLEFHMKDWTLHFAPRGDEYTYEWNGAGPN